MKGKELVNEIVKLLDEKKAEDIICLNISKHSTIADYFVIATGLVDTHVRSLAENMAVELKKHETYPLAHEGGEAGSWICVDYGDVIVHIMRSQERNYYNLESIWGGCPKVAF